MAFREATRESYMATPASDQARGQLIGIEDTEVDRKQPPHSGWHARDVDLRVGRLVLVRDGR